MCSTGRVAEWTAQLEVLPAPDLSMGGGLVAEVVALRRLAERAQVAYLARLAALDTSCSGLVDGQHVAAAVADEVGLPLRVTMRERTLARALHVDTERPCDATRAALTTGQLTTPQAEVIAGAMRQLLPDDVLNLEPTVAAACVAAAPSAADRICRHAVLVAGDDAALRREERAHASRHLHVSPCGDMVRVDGMLPGLEGATVLAALDALAQPTADETTPGNGSPRRSHGQRMADALTELARRQLNAGELPIHGGLRPNVHVTVTLHDLLAGTGTARIKGRSHAAVTAIAASRLACDAELDWAITGEQGAAVAATSIRGSTRTYWPGSSPTSHRRSVVRRPRSSRRDERPDWSHPLSAKR